MLSLHETKKTTKILIIDDEDLIREVMKDSLLDEGYEVFVAQDGETGLLKLKEHKPDVCFLDIWMPGQDGIEILKQAAPAFTDTSFIMISGHGTIETAVKATKLGAWDFIEKPLSLDKIHLAIEHVLKLRHERSEKLSLLNKLRKSIALVGESKNLQKVREQISLLAKKKSTVVICGEMGVGRELVSQNLHYMSDRASGILSELKCSTLPQDLIEIELFGINKGALPGIEATRKGKIELAQGGSLVIEEFEEIPLDLQEKIALYIETKGFCRLGSTDTNYADTRIFLTSSLFSGADFKVSTKISDQIKKLVGDNLIDIHPLRMRSEDIYPLVQHFSDAIAKQLAVTRKTISEQGIKHLEKHSWSGNVRELKNFIERVYILTPSDYVDVHDLKFAGLIDKKQNLNKEDSQTTDSGFATFREARAEFEKDYLIKKIQEHGGNISKTAESIGLERSYLHRKMKSYGIETN